MHREHVVAEKERRATPNAGEGGARVGLVEAGKRGHELFEMPQVSEGEQCPKGGSAIDIGAFCTVIVGP